MVFCSRWISSMKRTSPSSRLVNKPARSAAFSIVGPLVLFILAHMAFAMMFAMVVLPRPGGPLRRRWSMASPRCLAAATVISRRSLTLAWPVNSEKSDGRNVISNAASGLVSTSEMFRSAIEGRMREAGEFEKLQAPSVQVPEKLQAPIPLPELDVWNLSGAWTLGAWSLPRSGRIALTIICKKNIVAFTHDPAPYQAAAEVQ